MWLGFQWDEPNRTDFYLMQVAQELRTARLKEGVSLKQMVIPFTGNADEEGEIQDVEAHTKAAKAIWSVRMGKKIT